MKRLFFTLILISLLLSGCYKEKYNIVVSKIYNKSIPNWLKHNEKNLNIISAYGVKDYDSLSDLLSTADGIIISGGEDVSPYFYNEKDTANLVEETNPYRDSLEIFIINYAIKHNIPLLGICRGHQIINVVLGGSLIMDIPTYLHHASIHRKNHKHTFHYVYLTTKLPYKSCNLPDSGYVYSSHHQAVKKLGKQLKVFAIAKDSIIEGFYSSDTSKFVLGVQWHPEAMDFDNPYSKIIAQCFISAIKKHKNAR